MSELVNKEYLRQQFSSYSNVVKNTFAKKGEVQADNLEYTNIEAPNVSTVNEALDALFANGGSVLESDLKVTATDYDGVKGKTYTKGTELEQILRDLLVPYTKPTVNVVFTPNVTLYETGTSNNVTISAVVTKNTNPIASVKFYVNNTLVKEITTGISDGGTVSHSITGMTDTTVAKVVVNDGLNDVTASKTITYISKSYYGVVDSTVGEPTEALIKTLNSTLKNSKGYVYEGITFNYNKVVYCYPSSLGSLTSIMDKVNNFNYTTSFAKTTITVDGIEYYCYTQIDPSAASNLNLTFA